MVTYLLTSTSTHRGRAEVGTMVRHSYSILTNTFVGNHQYPPTATIQNLAPEAERGESHFSDSSGPLFSMYLERAEEEDKKMAENWKGDAEGILVFVSGSPSLLCFTGRLKSCRPVFSPPLSRHWFQAPYRTSSRTPRTLQRSTLRTFISCSPMKMDPRSSPLRHCPIPLLRSPHRRQLFGS